MGNKSEGKGWRRNIWGTRVRKRIEKKYMGNKEERKTNCDGKMRNERNPYERGVDKSI